MSGVDWAVIAGAVSAIAWVNWYFFLADRGVTPARSREGRTEGARR